MFWHWLNSMPQSEPIEHTFYEEGYVRQSALMY